MALYWQVSEIRMVTINKEFIAIRVEIVILVRNNYIRVRRFII